MKRPGDLFYVDLGAEGDFESVVALGGAGRGLVALLREAVDGKGFGRGGWEVGPGLEVGGGLDGLNQVVGGKVARDEDVVERGSEGLALEGVGDQGGGVAAGEGGVVGGAGVAAGGGGGPPAGGKVGIELGSGADADKAEAIAIGGLGPGVGVGVGEAFDDGSGGVVEGDGFARVIEVTGIVGGGEDELCAGGEDGAEGEGVGESGSEGEVAEVDLDGGDVGEFDEFVGLEGAGFVVVEFGDDEVGGVGGDAGEDVD